MLKLLYMYMLGYDIEFGHTMVVSLINATKFEEKQVGYTATAVLLNESHEFLRMVINSVREDIIGKVEHNQCLGPPRQSPRTSRRSSTTAQGSWDKSALSAS